MPVYVVFDPRYAVIEGVYLDKKKAQEVVAKSGGHYRMEESTLVGFEG